MKFKVKTLSLFFLILMGLSPNLTQAASKSESGWFDRSHRIFFPKDGQETVALSQSFPAFWWNFVVLDLKENDFSAAHQLCRKLKAMTPNPLLRVECNQGLNDLESISRDWAQDLPLRTDRPSDAWIKSAFDSDLAQASLPTGDRTWLKFLQSDPLQSWRELLKLVENRIKIKLERKNGFFYDSESHRIIIPVQAAFNPAEIQKTKQILAALSDFTPKMVWVGPHESTLRNQEQVMQDLNAATHAGYVILVLLGGALLWLKRWQLLLLFPPVFVAVSGGAVVTVLVFGSIHGLTLSFGSGIIGLALDYGFNAAFGNKIQARNTWRSNWIGVATTLVGLFVLMQSAIPLLRQMMVFSAVGLSTGFLVFRFLFARYPDVLITRPFGVSFSPSPIKTSIIFILLASSIAGFFILRPNLDMKQFDFEDAKNQQTDQWLFKTLAMRSPLFTVNEGDKALIASQKEKQWAAQNGIAIETLANYLPTENEQSSHLMTWITGQTDCRRSPSMFPDVEMRFFSGFIESSLCKSPTRLKTLSAFSEARSYTQHLSAEGKWLTLWMPTDDGQELKIRQNQPTAHSLREALMAFPNILAKELSWMAPLSVFLVLIILLFYYRKLDPSWIALIPFFSGLGLFSLTAITFNLSVSFISVIALVMSFGFSFDYAIFAVDHYVKERTNGVWGAISSAAAATLAGFVPLLFTNHPVLKHLGQALCLSTLGCYLGAVWGIPGLIELRENLKKPRLRS